MVVAAKSSGKGKKKVKDESDNDDDADEDSVEVKPKGKGGAVNKKVIAAKKGKKDEDEGEAVDGIFQWIFVLEITIIKINRWICCGLHEKGKSTLFFDKHIWQSAWEGEKSGASKDAWWLSF